jgi:UDP-N-acetylmuramoyl-tripeptide--D-alanyl-D-alanine ligase
MKYLLSEIALAAGGEIVGTDRAVSGACIDSRLAGPGNLFFALPGSRVDGHEFVDQVLAAGGCAVVSAHCREREGTVRVESVPDALLAAGSAIRSRLPGRVVAVTGSSGKTTTRDLIALALSPAYRVGCSRGNLNNRLGLPLSILNLDEDAEVFVLELGMNHAGELLELGGVARPDVSVVTNVGRAHIEFFDGHDSLARAKAELLDTTTEGGFCVIPAGEPVLAGAAAARGLGIATVGLDGDYRLVGNDSGWIVEPHGIPLDLAVSGRHYATNAVFAIAVAHGLGVDPACSAGAMGTYRGQAGRGQTFESCGMTIVDESYNANPDSMSACLDAFSGRPGRKAMILGDMLELGESSHRLHMEVLSRAASFSPELIILVGPLMREAAKALDTGIARFALAPGWAEALEILMSIDSRELSVLVKGSHSVGLDRVVEALRSEVKCSTGCSTR